MANRSESFAKESYHAHAALMHEITELEAWAGGEWARPPSRGHERLMALRAKLLAHFAFEEDGGYMTQVLEDAPHLDQIVQQLLEQHRQLADGLDALIDECIEWSGADLESQFFHKLRQWIDLVRAHESRENALVQMASNQDIGGEG